MLKLLCCAFVTKYVLTRTLYFFVQVSFIVYREVTKTLQDLPVIFINPFWTNVPLTDKPGSWFLLAKCLKSTCGRVTS